MAIFLQQKRKERKVSIHTQLYTMYVRENDTEMSLVDYISGPNTWVTGGTTCMTIANYVRFYYYTV